MFQITQEQLAEFIMNEILQIQEHDLFYIGKNATTLQHNVSIKYDKKRKLYFLFDDSLLIPLDKDLTLPCLIRLLTGNITCFNKYYVFKNVDGRILICPLANSFKKRSILENKFLHAKKS